jgi:hypothetical protein
MLLRGKGQPKTRVGFLGQQGKVTPASVGLGRDADTAQLLMQELLHLRWKRMLGFVLRRIQHQGPPSGGTVESAVLTETSAPA